MPTGKQIVGGVHGQKVVNQYQFQVALLFPQSQTSNGIANANGIPADKDELVGVGSPEHLQNIDHVEHSFAMHEPILA